MRIVDLQTFRELPVGTVYAKFKPNYFGDLCVKGDTWEHDFLTADLCCCVESNGSEDLFDKLDRMVKEGVSLPLDFDYYGRDGMFEPDQLFAVYERADVEQFIFKLNECRALGYST
jgi:hypothetical protein